jgi:hypothetical protein
MAMSVSRSLSFRRDRGRNSPSRRLDRRRRVAGALAGGVMLLNVGCYTYQPYIESGPQPGQHVSLELSDQGRAALGPQLGPGVLTVEGMLRGTQGGQYVLGVSRVTTIGAGTANWGGERVTIPVNDVARSQIRTFSRGRTALLVGAVVAGLAAFIVTRSLNGGGYQPSGGSTLPPSGT